MPRFGRVTATECVPEGETVLLFTTDLTGVFSRIARTKPLNCSYFSQRAPTMSFSPPLPTFGPLPSTSLAPPSVLLSVSPTSVSTATSVTLFPTPSLNEPPLYLVKELEMAEEMVG